MRRQGTLVRLAAAIVVVAVGADAAEPPRVIVPEGFVVTLYADDELASNIYSLTVDSQGRVVVAGPGYVRILLDADGDGRADSYKQFADGPSSGAQGLFFHGRDLLATGDGALLRFRDADADDRADGPPEVFLKIRAGGEHDAHAIRRGPDGWFYLLAGNGAGVTGKYATLASSPIRSPSAGTLLRLKPGLDGGEILVDGFRNAYDFAFNPAGDLFVYDSDGERDVSLPWYRPTRVFHALPGSGTGWISRSWKKPGYFLDMPPVVGAFGRGSPTGVACYRHTAFPAGYRGAVFALDWTFGRVVVLPLRPAGSSYRCVPSVFMSGRGHFGFAPTDIAVGPDGSLYISVGGRGTRGGVFRVTHPASARGAAARSGAPGTLAGCLRMPQPLASWSRARWVPLARRLGKARFEAAAVDVRRAADERVRAVEVLVELFDGPSREVLIRLARDKAAAVSARAAWAIGRADALRPDVALLKPFLADPRPVVGRAAAEALLGAGAGIEWAAVLDGLLEQLDSSDRVCRQTAAAVLTRMPVATWRTLAARACRRSPAAGVAAALGGRVHARGIDRHGLDVALGVLAMEDSPRVTPGLKLDAVRLAQLALGDVGPVAGRPAVFDGYASRLPDDQLSRVARLVASRLARAFPSRHRQLDHELARLAAMVSPADGPLLQKFLDVLTDDAHPVDDLHFLIAVSRIPLKRSAAQRQTIARSLVGLQAKIDRRRLNQDSNWDDRVGELYAALSVLDPELPASLLSQPGFGRPAHVQFLGRMPPAARARARKAFVKRIMAEGEDYAWTGEIVRMLSASSDPAHRKLLRSAYERFSVRSAVLIALARQPERIDRQRFVEGLESSSLDVLEACLTALGKLPVPRGDAADARHAAEMWLLLQTLRRMGTGEREHRLRSLAVVLMRRRIADSRGFAFVTGKRGRTPQTEAIRKWTAYLEKTLAKEARRRLGAGVADLPALKKRLATVDWDKGQAVRGRRLFVRRGCVQCHGGRRALGPDLAGAAGRFSREDLFTAIALPNRDVSPRYQVTLVQTTRGKVYTGLVVYDSVDGITLRTGTNETLRLEASEIALRVRRPESLMPGGLLKELSTADLADLWAYLATLKR